VDENEAVLQLVEKPLTYIIPTIHPTSPGQNLRKPPIASKLGLCFSSKQQRPFTQFPHDDAVTRL